MIYRAIKQTLKLFYKSDVPSPSRFFFKLKQIMPHIVLICVSDDCINCCTNLVYDSVCIIELSFWHCATGIWQIYCLYSPELVPWILLVHDPSPFPPLVHVVTYFQFLYWHSKNPLITILYLFKLLFLHKTKMYIWKCHPQR